MLDLSPTMDSSVNERFLVPEADRATTLCEQVVTPLQINLIKDTISQLLTEFGPFKEVNVQILITY
jgi:hypothetical protein